jgi:transketolase
MDQNNSAMSKDFQAAPKNTSSLDQLAVNTIRFLSVDAVQRANSGHPGLPLDAAPMAYVLWMHYLKFNPHNPDWFDRDRFILSAGHGSMLLYSLLYLTGYDLSLEQLKQFRQWESLTPGHPESRLTPGVETTTGPLGQGFGNGVGMAIAEAYLAARFNRPGYGLIDHYTYAIVSDGDLMEGVGSESASIAGDLKLGKLIYFYDNNKVTLSAGTDITFNEDVSTRFRAYGWQVLEVADGNDLSAIERAIQEARREQNKPSLISIRTHLGYGSPLQDKYEAHGSPLGAENVLKTKQNLGWPVEPDFYVPEEVLKHFRQAVERGKLREAEWNEMFGRYSKEFPDLAGELHELIQGKLPAGWEQSLLSFPPDPKGLATRVASGRLMNALAGKLPMLVGGSADLNPSTHTELKDHGDFESPLRLIDGVDTQGSSGGGWSYAGRNLHFGVREHGMGAILNGIATFSGLIPYGSTFLIFSDYMRPPMRLAALMGLHVIYVFTHDSIGLGQDGPTHQPVEQLANLRAVPNLVVIRPADANETREAWKVALEHSDGPVALVLTRQNLPTMDRSIYGAAEGLVHGAYILSESQGGLPDIILVATGSEVQLVLQAQVKLAEQGIKARVVSMPSWELFDKQPKEYRRLIFPPGLTARLAVEAGSPQGWDKYVGAGGEVIGLDHFGASAPGEVLMEKFGFTVENVVGRAIELVKH